MNNIKKATLMSLLLVLFWPVITLAQTSEYQEYTLKAEYLERFTHYTEWPEESAISDTSQPFVLGVIGESPFGSILDDTYAKLKIRDKNVEIRYYSKPAEIEGCHLLFIGNINKKSLSEILAHTKVMPVLIVSDTKDFASEGVHINLYLSQEKVRFEINESAVKESGLQMSYKLLKLGKIVIPTEKKK